MKLMEWIEKQINNDDLFPAQVGKSHSSHVTFISCDHVVFFGHIYCFRRSRVVTRVCMCVHVEKEGVNGVTRILGAD